MKKKQKDVFLDSEANAWFDRNHRVLSCRNYEVSDPVIQAIDHCLEDAVKDERSEGLSLLEVGCGGGHRLQWLQGNRKLQCSGIEPSTKAVELATSLGIHAVRGTADRLPFSDHLFDFVVFGFCLYLCDREDLFKIANEADRVLKKTGWLIVHDFFSSEPSARPYHHLDGIKSFKMDYRKLWDWNPAYSCFFHQLSHHSSRSFTDDRSEWVATSVLRKNIQVDR